MGIFSKWFGKEAAPSDGQDRGLLAPGGASLMPAWSAPPQRGSLELLGAYVASPPFRAVVNRVVQGYMLVDWFDFKEPDQRDFDAPIVQLINNYNSQLIGSKGRALEQKYLDVCGEVFTVMFPTSTDRRFELFPVPPTWVRLDTVAGKRVFQIRLGDQYFEFQEHEVIWRKDEDLVNPYGRGKGGGWAVMDELDANEYAQKFVKSYFYNSAQPQFIASVKNATKDQATQLQKAFESKHQGFRKAWAPNFTSAELDIHELTRNVGSDRIEEMQKYWADVVRWLYGVPPEIIGMIENSNRSTIKEAEQLFGKFVIEPRVREFQETWQILMAPNFPGKVNLQHTPAIPRSFDRRDEIMSRHSHNFTRNEVRAEAGFEPVRDGDVYMVPGNLVAAEAQRTFAEASSVAPTIKLVGTE